VLLIFSLPSKTLIFSLFSRIGNITPLENVIIFYKAKPQRRMECCIMLNPKFCLCLMHILEMVVFEFVAHLHLNSKEKQKRELKFRIKGKKERSPRPLPLGILV
jgi:hypothetical protein